MNVPTARILVVDDEPTVREVVGEYLRRDGYDVCEVARGDDVDAAMLHFSPDLVVLDVMLPAVSGIDLLRDGRTRGMSGLPRRQLWSRAPKPAVFTESLVSGSGAPGTWLTTSVHPPPVMSQ